MYWNSDFLNSEKGSLAEWSKAVDLSSTIERCVGSNPTASIKSTFCMFFLSCQHVEELAGYDGSRHDFLLSLKIGLLWSYGRRHLPCILYNRH